MEDSFDFYYDSMINSPDLTFRIIGVESTLDTPKSSAAKVIIRDFIREPISYAIAHNYDQNSGGLVSMATNIKTALESWGVKYERFKAQFGENFLDDFMSFFNGDTKNTASGKAYQVEVPWIDFFKTFSSTQISVPLNFNVRLYPKYNNNGALTTVKDQLKEINKYFIGTGKDEGNLYVYSPPHGYSPTVSSVKDNKVGGTLTLLYGRFAVIEGLILTNYQVTLSRELIRSSPKGTAQYSPAYADVSITLAPATSYTREDINNILASDFKNTETTSRSWLLSDGSKISDYYDKYKE